MSKGQIKSNHIMASKTWTPQGPQKLKQIVQALSTNSKPDNPLATSVPTENGCMRTVKTAFNMPPTTTASSITVKSKTKTKAPQETPGKKGVKWNPLGSSTSTAPPRATSTFSRWNSILNKTGPSSASLPQVQETLLAYLVNEFGCPNPAILNIVSKTEFIAFTTKRGLFPPMSGTVKYDLADFPGLQKALHSPNEIPIVLNTDMHIWGQVFFFFPTVLILVPTKFYAKDAPGTLPMRESEVTTNTLVITNDDHKSQGSGMTRSSIRGSTHGSIRKSTHSPLRKSTHGPIHGSTHNPIRGSTLGPVHGSTHSIMNIHRIDKTNAFRDDIIAVTALAFKSTILPLAYTNTSTWHALIDTCAMYAPIMVNVFRSDQQQSIAKHLWKNFNCVRNVELDIHDIVSCVNSIGIQLQAMTGASHCMIFAVQDDMEASMYKYTTIGYTNLSTKCPDKQKHYQDSFAVSAKYPSSHAAIIKKCVRINGSQDLWKKCGSKDELHSYGFCLVKNMLCVYIEDILKDTSLVVELSDKQGGFTEVDEQNAKLFANRMTHVLSTAVMLDKQKNDIRKQAIANKLLNNITKVQFVKVKNVLDFKFKESGHFSKKIYDPTFSVNQLPPEQYVSFLLFIFSELRLMERFDIARAKLVRFFYTLSQGYLDNAYHNWKHACSVTHFAFYLIKQLSLVKKGFLTDLDALAVLLACLSHDIGRRGVSSHFELLQPQTEEKTVIYRQEESLGQRHNVALTLQILTTDDCNILENMADTDFKEVVQTLQHCIVATDVEKFLKEKAQLYEVMQKYNKKKKEDKPAFLSVFMMVCDLSENVKMWDDYILTTIGIFSEFFDQGDEEIRMGYIPSPIMDRRLTYLPFIEYKFLDGLVRPLYKAFGRIFSKIEQCTRRIDYHIELWIIATRIFDDHALIRNPIEVLELDSMKESNLRVCSNPQLKKRASQFRRRNARTPGIQTMDHHKASTPSENRIASMLLSSEGKVQQWKEYLFCVKCRNKALADARFMRQNRRDAAFMENRNEEYFNMRGPIFLQPKELVNISVAETRKEGQRISEILKTGPLKIQDLTAKDSHKGKKKSVEIEDYEDDVIHESNSHQRRKSHYGARRKSHF